MFYVKVYWVFLFCIFVSDLVYANKKSSALSNTSCINCHSEQTNRWLKSDHAKSMGLADKNSILANFNNIKVEHYGQKSYFYIKNDVYYASVSYDNKTQTFPIKYTFGHYPLQQYIVETEPGRLQVLPFAWDSRTSEKGGQRWYHNYSQEEIRPEDRLHWRQPLQNWNGMCADCHSDGLNRNYKSDKNRFESKYDNINVGCLSCHGNMSNHATKYLSKSVIKEVLPTKQPTGQWLRSAGQKTASWQGEARNNRFMDICFACHSLRTPLSDGIDSSKAFLDQFSPQLPSTPNYHADGQIKEEVYVYGSFLQSKMHSKGVNCLDCHDKHTMKLKIEGNGLCLQCHSNEVFNVKSHLQHKSNSPGAQCVNCHMAETRYMGVDDRRDHSFKIPRPDLSELFNTPNACIKCHNDKPNQWAIENTINWYGKPKRLPLSKQLLLSLNSGNTISLKKHLAIIGDENLDIASRASALELLGLTTQSIPTNDLLPYLTHKNALLRLSAAKVSRLLSLSAKEKYVSQLLKDELKAVRVAAARNLLSTDLFIKNSLMFAKAFNELIIFNDINSWRGEGRANQALQALDNNVQLAEKKLIETIEIEPFFDAGYINLADLYRSQNRSELVATTLKKGMKNVPLSGALNYAFGLYLVREKQLDKAISYFDKSMKLSLENSQYAYTFILALDGLGKSQLALESLKKLIAKYQNKKKLKELGLYLSKKLLNQQDYRWFMAF